MQPVPCGAGLGAEIRPFARRGDPLHHPSRALFAGVHLADEPHLAAALAIRYGDSVPCLLHLDPDEDLARMPHGSSSRGEDRLGGHMV